MKKIFYAAIPVLAVAAAFAVNVDPLPLGAPVPKPELKMKDVSGKEISLQEVQTSKGLLVMFSCNTCPYVVKNEQRTVAMGDFAAKLNVGVIIINSNEAYRGTEDSFEAMKEYASEKKYNWFYVVDKNSEVADAFGANRTPECFLFNKQLKLVYHGAIDDNPSDEAAVKRQHLREAITEMAEGKEVSVKESRSVGCTIKRKA